MECGKLMSKDSKAYSSYWEAFADNWKEIVVGISIFLIIFGIYLYYDAGRIAYELTKKQGVRYEIYDMAGNLIKQPIFVNSTVQFVLKNVGEEKIEFHFSYHGDVTFNDANPIVLPNQNVTIIAESNGEDWISIDAWKPRD